MSRTTAEDILWLKDGGRLARPGWNCWRSAVADRLGVLVDAEDYFLALAEAISLARRSILILGWEFDSRTQLARGGGGSPLAKEGLPNRIGPLLDAVVRRTPGLTAHVLIWDSAFLYAVNREFAGLVKMDWLTHRRLHFRLDDSHPLGASHHQKVVVIDDALAFIGGLDVTSQRWDTRRHAKDDPRRSDPAVPRYPPFHDVMAVVTGAAAAALADLCRQRWRACTGECLPVPPAGDGDRLWPKRAFPLFSPVEVAIARTSPSWDGVPATHEVERLYLDMIAAAERFIFIENQYFAARRVGDAIAARLKEPASPEVVVIGPGYPVSIMERSSMGVARARIGQRLCAADRCGRFQLYYPTVDGEDVKVHSKLMIVDDRLLRIGTSNINNRSLGLDTECDVLVEACGDPAIEAGIRRLRQDLMAEHLGASPAAVAVCELESGGLHACIAALGGGRRSLVPLDCTEPAEIVRLIADSNIPDPEEPMESLVFLEDGARAPLARRPLLLRLRAMIAVLAGLALAGALWRWAPPEMWRDVRPWVDGLADLRERPGAVAVVAVCFTLAGLLRVPVPLLVLATAVSLGPWLGAVDSLVAALTSASLHYALGFSLGRRRVRRLSGWKVNRVARALSRHGIAAIVLLRLMPVAAFAVINMVAGSTRVRFRDFIAGTGLGMAPGIFAMSVLGDRVLAVLRNPSAINVAVLALAAALVIGAIVGLANRLGRARAPKSGRSREV
ncbi:MAG: VTT domain-containing protein [Magnetospirillum sp.]|nr:VTT domain-containing protein [Magnetospirillum sp.]